MKPDYWAVRSEIEGCEDNADIVCSEECALECNPKATEDDLMPVWSMDAPPVYRCEVCGEALTDLTFEEWEKHPSR